MAESTTARVRLESDLQGEADNDLVGGPVSLQCFNNETGAVLRDSEQGRGVARFDTAEALFQDLEIGQNA